MCFLMQRVWYLFILLSCVSCRIHKLILKDDERRYVDLTTFGFYEGGILEVKMINFKLPSGPVMGQYGFTLDRTINDAVSPYLEAHSDSCFLNENASILSSSQHQAFILFLRLDFNDLRLKISCSDTNSVLRFYPSQAAISIDRRNRQEQYIFVPRRKRASQNDDYKQLLRECPPALHITKKTSQGYDYYNTSFAMYVAWKKGEGLYNLYFHNCPDAKAKPVPTVNLMMEIYESNNGNFLSAGEMPLPALYSMMSLIFFLSAGFWTFILKTSKHTVYRIHIIMCVLVYLKALSLAFHGINYHFIQTKGEHVTAWAILFYITHLLKGAVLFVTIVLVGTGWNFIKHILTDRDKKLFMIVIPLQVVANVAEIIISESEEGALEHTVWRDIFILVDILCCCAILFPVVWSIRHLQDASTTDGKAAINLEKLKLFRHFYIMVVCYIYFTRFVISLLKVVVSFQYAWIDEMFRELAAFVFFVMTGYKFRPAAANPYFTPNVEDDVDPQVLSEIGILDGVTKVKRGSMKRCTDMQPLMQEKYYDSD